MASAILGDEIAKIGPNTHVCHGRLLISPALDGKSLKEDETFAMEDALAHRFEETREFREMEKFLKISPDPISQLIPSPPPQSTRWYLEILLL